MRICTVTGNKEKGVKIMPRPYLGDPKYTIEVLQKYNFAFQKRFGQNFLIDTHVLDKIIDSAQITKDDFVLEIGPGIGTMTQYLAEAAREVAAVEIDKTLLPILHWKKIRGVRSRLLPICHITLLPRSSWDCLRIRFLLILLLLWYRKKLRTECR